MKKQVVLIALLMSLALLLTACAGGGVQGAWKAPIKTDGTKYSQRQYTLTLQDGKAILTETRSAEGAYEVNGDQLVLHIQGEEKTLTIDGNSMTVNGQEHIVFTR